MITNYVRAPDTVARMRASCVGPYLDHLASTMAETGFKSLTIVEHLRTVVQFATWAERRGVDLACWDESILAGFRQHLVRRKLAKRERALGHAAQFLAYLQKDEERATACLAADPFGHDPRKTVHQHWYVHRILLRCHRLGQLRERLLRLRRCASFHSSIGVRCAVAELRKLSRIA